MKVSDRAIIGNLIKKRAPEILDILIRNDFGRLDPESLPFKDAFSFRKKASKEMEEWTGNWYVIVTPTDPENMLYIFSRRELYRRRENLSSVRVLGLAASRHEAREIVREIFEEGVLKGYLSPGTAEDQLTEKKSYQGMREFLENY